MVRSSNRTDHTSLRAQFSSDQSTNLIHSWKRTTKHIGVGYYNHFAIIMRALRVNFEKLGAVCMFSRFATQRFELLQAHVAVDLIRSAQVSPTTVGGLRTRQIAMVGESEPPFACNQNVVPSSNRTDHMIPHAQFSSDQSTNLIHSRKRITKHICVGYYHSFSIMMRALRVIF